MEVDRGHHVSTRREHRVVPACPPVVGPGTLRPAVNQVDQRIPPGRVEAGRLEQPPEDGVSLRAHEAECVERPEIERFEHGVGMMRELPAGKPDLVGLGVTLVQVHEPPTVRHDLDVGVDPTAANYDGTTERRELDPVDVVAPALVYDDVETLRIRTPRVRAHGQSPSDRGFGRRPSFRPAVLSSKQQQSQSIRLEPGPLHREVRKPVAVRRIARGVVGSAPRRHRPHSGTVRPHDVDIDVRIVGDRGVAVHGDRDLFPVG